MHASCIDLVQGEPALRQRVNAVFRPVSAISPEVAYSDLTRLECRVKPLASANAALLARYDRFFSTPGYIHTLLDPRFRLAPCGCFIDGVPLALADSNDNDD